MSDSPLTLPDDEFLEFMGSNPELPTPTVEDESTVSNETTEPETQQTEETQSEDTTADQTQEKSDNETEEEDTFDYRDFYQQVMSPIKANGKTVELQTPDEAIKLMQMGANYTKKMQAIAAHRKILMMLENNGLLDEQKLTYLIDLDKKNPEAVKKLVKDSAIDPLDIDLDSDPKYTPGYHKVSDEQLAFANALDALKETPTGIETISTINSTWDEQSKDALWKNPDLLETIHSQRENGIYSKITSEIERRRVLGGIPSNIPFLQAYKIVGDELNAAGAFNTGGPIATRVQAPKPKLNNSNAARAAATTRTSNGSSKSFINPLSMSDDDFLKQMANRV